MNKISEVKKYINEYELLYIDNKDKIHLFLKLYFELESIILYLHSDIKTNPNSRTSSIDTKKLKKKGIIPNEVVDIVFFGNYSKDKNLSCRILRNEIVHNIKKRKRAMEDVINRYEFLIEKMNVVKNILLDI